MWNSQYTSDYLLHHGILGQKWGTRNGPPYPLKGGNYTQTEKHAIEKARKSKNSIYNKKHYDQVLKSKSTTLTTLSYNKDRTKNTDMFYAAHTRADKHQYNALFNRKVPMPIYDKEGNEVGTSKSYKFAIDNKLLSDIKVASEDSGSDAFMTLYSKDRDFYNFVTDPSRMQAHFVKDKYKFKGYREGGEALNKLRTPDYTPTDKDIQVIYRMFNYVLPSDAGGNQRMAKDVMIQRAKFFKLLKARGYGVVLDTNDAIYGGFKTTSPVIVFDMEQVVLSSIREITDFDKKLSELAFVGRKVFNI